MSQSSRSLCQALRISVDDLRVGMFVAELDRPWTQTPFMLQGFLLTEVLDLQSLQAMVKELVIDPLRSNPKSLLHLHWESLHVPVELESAADAAFVPETRVFVSHLPAPESVSLWQKIASWRHNSETKPGQLRRPKNNVFDRHTGNTHGAQARSQPKPYYLRYDPTPESVAAANAKLKQPGRSSRFQPSSTFEFSQVLQTLFPRDAVFAKLDWLEHWRNWQEQREKDKRVQRGQNIRKQIFRPRKRAYIPKTMHLVVYKDHSTLQQEVVYARTAIEKADCLLKKLSEEITSDRNIALVEVAPTVELLTESVISNPSALMWLLRMRSENSETYAHGLKVAIYMMTLGRQLGFSRQQLTELGFVGLLLDIGKLELPESLWSKPDKFSADEHSMMQTHVNAAVNMLSADRAMNQNILLGISEHHERLDGSGYPQGISGAGISLFGRISAIADSFAAMTSERPYDVTRSSFDAMKELFKEAGSKLHSALVEEFVQAIGVFPVGSMIELSSGEVAIVLEHNKVRRLEPKVLLLTATDKSILDKPALCDLMRQKIDAENRRKKILRGLPDGAYGLVYRDFYRAS
ncbi:MAG: HD-GYP domain-containing protein [Burkholderiales bacterium]|nr:HD-GYP domain-containing protein [Burkholderiales bacterium]